MLTPQELREFSKVSNGWGIYSIVSTWLLIIATFAIPLYWQHPAAYILAMILMARHQLSLAILMHDAAHKRLFTDVIWNDYAGQFFLASPVLFSLTAYRSFHLKHHKEPLAPDDPDITLTGGYPIPRASFLRKLLRDISGMSYFKFIKYFISKSRTEKTRVKQSKTKRSGPSFKQVIAMMLVANILILTALTVFANWYFYPLLWLLPAFTILQVFLRIRGVAEHAGYEMNSDQRLNSRTIICPWQTFFVAPNNVNYHIEHHVYPSVPWYYLPKVHKLMRERGSIPETNFYSGYGAMLREILT